MADASGAACWGPLIKKSGMRPHRPTEDDSAGTGLVATSPETDSLARLRRNLSSFVPGSAGLEQNEMMFSTVLSRCIWKVYSPGVVGNLCINQIGHDL